MSRLWVGVAERWRVPPLGGRFTVLSVAAASGAASRTPPGFRRQSQEHRRADRHFGCGAQAPAVYVPGSPRGDLALRVVHHRQKLALLRKPRGGVQVFRAACGAVQAVVVRGPGCGGPVALGVHGGLRLGVLGDLQYDAADLDAPVLQRAVPHGRECQDGTEAGGEGGQRDERGPRRAARAECQPSRTSGSSSPPRKNPQLPSDPYADSQATPNARAAVSGGAASATAVRQRPRAHPPCQPAIPAPVARTCALQVTATARGT